MHIRNANLSYSPEGAHPPALFQRKALDNPYKILYNTIKEFVLQKCNGTEFIMGAKFHGEAIVGSALEEKEKPARASQDEKPRHSHIYDRYNVESADESLSALCQSIHDELIFMYTNKVGWRGEWDAFDNKVPDLRLAEKRKIAQAITDAMMSNTMHDQAILDGMSPFMASLKYKKYSHQYFEELKQKFWS